MVVRPAYFVLLFTAIGLSAYGQTTEVYPYFSPGIGISWNSGAGFVVAPKFSLGCAWNGRFVNLTYTIVSGSRNNYKPFYALEVQGGTLSYSNQSGGGQVFYGGGMGIALQPDSAGYRVYPRATAFVGMIVFLTADIMAAEKTQIGFGLEGVLPIPLRRLNFSLGG